MLVPDYIKKTKKGSQLDRSLNLWVKSPVNVNCRYGVYLMTYIPEVALVHSFVVKFRTKQSLFLAHCM